MELKTTRLYLPARVIFLCVLTTCSLLTWADADEGVENPETRQQKPNIERDSFKSIAALNDALEKYHAALNDYQQTIMAIEDTHGVYDQRLIEPLTAYGLAQKEQSDHSGAIETLKRTEHLIRVNHGLYHLNQLPVLNELVDSYSATNNWSMAGKTQLHMLQIEKHNYQRNDPRLLASVDNLMNWYLYHYKQTWGLRGIQVLLNSRTMNLELIELLEQEHPARKRRLAEAYDALAKKDFLLARYYQTHTLEGNPPLHTLQNLSENAPDTDPDDTEMLFFNPYKEGKTALLKRVQLLDQIQGISLDERIDARLRLGDWYLIANHRQAALDSYRKGFDMAAENEKSISRLEFLFSRPRELQFDPFFASENAPGKLNQKQNYVDFVFDVTVVGKTRKIRILNSEAVSIKDKNLHKMMLATRFRPRMVGSELVATEGVTYRYKF